MSEYVFDLDERELRAHAAFLEALARRLVRDVHLARDVVQDTLAVAALSERPPRAGLRAWLAGVLRNRVRMTFRSEARRAAREQLAARPPSVAGPEELVQRLEMQRVLLRAVQELPEPYREVVVRRFYEDLTTREIAEIVGAPESTVRTRLQRGLARLRDALDDEVNGDRAAWCVALLGLPAASVTSTADAGSTATATPGSWITGVVAMSSQKTWIAASAAVLLLLVAGTVIAVRSPSRLGVGDDLLDAAGDGGAVAHDPIRRRGGSEASGVEETPVAESGAKTTLETHAIDRDRDLHGVVHDVRGAPIEGARVGALRRPWARTAFLGAAANAEAETGPECVTDLRGAFRLRLGPGELVDLRVQAEGFAELVLRDRQAGAREVVVLHEGATLVAQVRDEAGHPVERARVRLANYRHERSPAVSRTATTDTRGTARFAGLPPTVVWLHAEHAELGSRGGLRVSIAGEGLQAVAVTLHRGRPVRGMVADRETRTGIAGAIVTTTEHPLRRIETDEEGLFEIANRQGRAGTVAEARARGYGRQQRLVPDDGPLLFVLERGDTVVGRILDPSGRPVSGAHVAVAASIHVDQVQQTDAVSGRTAGDGSFELGALRRDLSHTLIVHAHGFGKLLHDVPAHPAEPGIIRMGDLRLERGKVIAGDVLTEDGAPIVGATVVLTCRTEYALDSYYGNDEERRTDDLGRFRFPDHAAGPYQLRVLVDGRSDVVRKLEVTRDADVTNLSIEVPTGRRLDVSVRDTHGVPVPGVRLRVHSRDVHSSWVATDEDGRALLVSELGGTWTLVVLPPPAAAGGAAYLERTLDAVDPDTGSLEITLQRVVSVTGHVLDPAGNPVPRALVRALADDPDRPVGEAVTNDAGAFDLRVPPGAAYRLVFDGTQQGSDTWIRTETLPFRGELAGIAAPHVGCTIRTERLRAERSLTVRVLTPGGDPVEGAGVVATTQFGFPQAPDDAPRKTTDANGETFFDGLTSQRHRVFVFHPSATASLDNAVRPAMLELVPDDEAREIAFRRGVPLTGVVVDAGGTPLGGARLSLNAHSGLWLTSTTADDDGRFRLTALPEHDHQLAVFHTVDGTARQRLFRPQRAGEGTVLRME